MSFTQTLVIIICETRPNFFVFIFLFFDFYADEKDTKRCEKCGWWIINGFHWGEKVE